MCFFDQIKFACGDWKWSHFRQHCNHEYRIGETCGMKLVMSTVEVGQDCKLCEKIKTKYRRRQAEAERITRWNREPHKYRASIQKSLETIGELDEEIRKLGNDRQKKLQTIGAQSSPYGSVPYGYA